MITRHLHRCARVLVLLTLTGLVRGVAAQDLTVSSDLARSESVYAIDNVTVRNGATLTIAGGSVLNASGTVQVTGSSTILLQGKNTDGQMHGVGVTINAADVQVDAGSHISADGQGYIGTAGPGAGGSDQFCNGASAGSGGGYGRAGGTDKGGAPGGSTYGVPLAPIDLGSGGGNNPAAGCGVTTDAMLGPTEGASAATMSRRMISDVETPNREKNSDARHYDGERFPMP